MKRNEIKALSEKSVAELQKQVGVLQTELAKAQLEKKANKLANPRLVSRLRDDIARIKTMMSVKETEETK